MEYRAVLWLLTLVVLANSVFGANERIEDEPRGGKLKKVILPFLIGIVLKATTIVPIKLMIMAFTLVLSIFLAKIALALGIAVGIFQFKQHQKTYPTPDMWHEATQYSSPTEIDPSSTSVEERFSPSQPYNVKIRRVHYFQ